MDQKSRPPLDPAQLAIWPISDFLKKLSSEEPIPGGGSVSALAGAMGASLIVMYCRIGVLRKGISSDDQEVLQKTSIEAASYLEELTRLITEDSLAYGEVMAGFKLPKSTEEEGKQRQLAIQKAFQRAIEVPMDTLRACIECLYLVAEVAPFGNSSAFSDLKVAEHLCHAGAKGALENIDINLASVKDQNYLKQTQARVDKLKHELEQAARQKVARPA